MGGPQAHVKLRTHEGWRGPSNFYRHVPDGNDLQERSPHPPLHLQSNFPRFDVNPNTGEPLNDNRRSATAVNTIYHDDRHPSQIVLPTIPAI
jgi:hypothetical protein